MQARLLTLVVILLFFGFTSRAQQSVLPDTVRQLDEVVVQSYQYNRPLAQVPLAYGTVDSVSLNRFGGTSLLPAVNSLPGIRMEERSPGSYRFSIRGSTLRSPFGVRNVKVYLNDLPFTDPGGNTYLNLLDLSAIGSVEIMKGPGGSLYGAGTGGVLLLRSPTTRPGQRNLTVSTTLGSYGSLLYGLRYATGGTRSNSMVQYNHQQSDSYREQSAMRRDMLQYLGSFALNERSTLTAQVLLADLSYETPGGLTKAQYDTQPAQARPPAGPTPGAVEQEAAVNNKTVYGGVTHSYEWNSKWTNLTGAYFSFSDFENPTIRNYEQKEERGFGVRSTTEYSFAQGKLNFGAEFQSGFSPVDVYDNNEGDIGDLQNSDELGSTNLLVFAQADFRFPGNVFLTLGSSLNFFSAKFTRLSDVPAFTEDKTFSPELSPRIALLKEFGKGYSLYASWSRGFSPPTIAELYPSTASFNEDLDAEIGMNYEIGFRGTWFQALHVDVSVYSFRLTDAIVIRRDDTGAEYFVNAGGTVQNGIELYANWKPAGRSAIKPNVWTSYTLNDFMFKDYQQGTDDFSDNPVTGVPKQIWVGGFDLQWSRCYAQAVFTYNDELPLNDAGTEYAEAYSLLSFKLGWRQPLENGLVIDAFVGGDNLLNEKYSLGNDLNAFGGRYYNAAMPRNGYAGIRLNIGMGKNNQ